MASLFKTLKTKAALKRLFFVCRIVFDLTKSETGMEQKRDFLETMCNKIIILSPNLFIYYWVYYHTTLLLKKTLTITTLVKRLLCVFRFKLP